MKKKMNRILDVLNEKGESQSWLANNSKGELSRQAISLFCKQKSQPSLKTLFLIAEILKVKPARLLGDGSEIIEEKEQSKKPTAEKKEEVNKVIEVDISPKKFDEK